ncbi:MAG: 4-(cytidine 5'-diphospho)-2-C-methyl-D-erythritol kinase [Hyphomicrobiaceae bacterium]|nr:4-(cytidine 5'-diphospho)-2-C-methyl-D-erythritol kinase [Hyphomicrobiaceae bacterium]
MGQRVPRNSVVEAAPPKVNLTLTVLGRRPSDGYHELDSIVAFAHDIADTVTLTPQAPPVVTSSGPFAPSIAGENLLDVALRAVAAASPGLALGAVHLDKQLPIAAGIGGGSADAAALLRAIRRANPGAAAAVDWHGLAARLGADVPVCLAAYAQRMTGVGERLMALPNLPILAAVLVNPLAPVPADKTARVFRTLAAGPVAADDPRLVETRPAFAAQTNKTQTLLNRADLIAHMRATGNDLTAAATAVVPEVADVLAALRATADCELAQLSGGGPTCFGVYPDMAAADLAAVSLRRFRPGWWIAASRLA